ncbi:MAG: SET domain-containing protein-lysine N-methyltransferase [Roseofilum sp. SBFL]|uniref:SET domain-containing protein-lysine N-methyltransferase n=1 Tax=unclassified Roseofilum TaxID=2620099 RepID=UPI001B133D24|nr:MULTISPECIES: SET domain-containing protein-lysine N-methyltransferase [unclassified Roseofilum]MBP0014857.1 SET domain-containing protein-lysine N-methyltransferase [Roseofilum sp. SID3]MBP0024638.1 SET domain-containing protein-lysine N-methyltransferase [Roseofilum sp. SID2]MBP0036666.1 SET domain-containing protein-lysine N-methyltransferase [Roseofilum sp. SID1]MBP0043396.1 SET domain-containing protein-lysine N-methyltransferase [Roseofilum sp. SBFL]
MIEIQLFPEKGRGVVATQFIPQGTLIEKAPVVDFPAEERSILDSTQVFKYYFVIPSEYDQRKEVRAYLVFGLASFCNHSGTPNTHINWVEDKTGLWAYLIASEEIKPGEECLMFYTNIDQYSF